MTICNEKTNDYEVNEDIMKVIEENNKTYMEYVKKYAELLLDEVIYDFYDLKKYFYEDFDESIISFKTLDDSFGPAIFDYLSEKDTIRTKMYFKAKELLDIVPQCADTIGYYAKDVESTSPYNDVKTIESYLDAIDSEVSEIRDFFDTFGKVKKLIKNKGLDNKKLVKISFNKELLGHDAAPMFSCLHLGFEKEYDRCYLIFLDEMFSKDKTNNEQNRNGNNVWFIELPEDATFSIYNDYAKENREITTTQLKELLEKTL